MSILTKKAKPIVAAVIAVGMMVQAGSADAQRRGGTRGGGAGMAARGAMPTIERQGEPRGYQRVQPPTGFDRRPQAQNWEGAHHAYQARQTYHVGAYAAPHGWRYRRWSYGDILPAIYWGAQYRVLDYWLFGLDTPPIGYEWVRYGPDALLINLDTGEVVQTVYGSFD